MPIVRTTGWAACTLFPAMLWTAASAQAQTSDLERTREALGMISEFAQSFCGELSRSGSSSTLAVSGEAEAKLKGLLEKLADLGIKGSAGFDSAEYVNVLQADLPAELQDVRECRERVWEDLKEKILSPAPADPSSSSGLPSDARVVSDIAEAAPHEWSTHVPELAARWSVVDDATVTRRFGMRASDGAGSAPEGQGTVRYRRVGSDTWLLDRLDLRAARAEGAPPETGATGELVVRSNVAGSRLRIDGEPAGTTGATRHALAAGTYAVRVDEVGFTPFETDVVVTAGETKEIVASLRPESVPQEHAAACERYSEWPEVDVLEPQVVELPPGEFVMGSDRGMMENRPAHAVAIAYPFAIGKYEVTRAEFAPYVRAATGGAEVPFRIDGANGKAPITSVSWQRAVDYGRWLACRTGKPYRLPTEAEWEFAARAGAPTRYWWGDDVRRSRALAHCEGCVPTSPRAMTTVGRYRPNAFGLHDTSGNVAEWVQDCWYGTYEGAPVDGSARESPVCEARVHRGGSWRTQSKWVDNVTRERKPETTEDPTIGFRLALDL